MDRSKQQSPPRRISSIGSEFYWDDNYRTAVAEPFDTVAEFG